MVGSKKWFKYTTDKGDEFAIFLDESVTEDANGTGKDYTNTDTQQYAVPSNVVPRRAYYSNSDGTRTIRATILLVADYNALDPSDTIVDPIGTGNLNLVRKTPEKIRLPKGVDTGQTDADAT